MANFNPRLPRGRRHRRARKLSISAAFQSTPPSREATVSGDCPQCGTHIFQSTPPSREATAAYSRVADRWPISIHASLAGGDGRTGDARFAQWHFNPRLPRGRRHTVTPFLAQFSNFNPRLPRGRRLNRASPSRFLLISIHASLAGGDDDDRSGGEAAGISIHASLAGGDYFTTYISITPYHISIHASLAGGDH